MIIHEHPWTALETREPKIFIERPISQFAYYFDSILLLTQLQFTIGEVSIIMCNDDEPYEVILFKFKKRCRNVKIGPSTWRYDGLSIKTYRVSYLPSYNA